MLDCFIYLQHCQICDHLERRQGSETVQGFFNRKLFLAEPRDALSVLRACGACTGVPQNILPSLKDHLWVHDGTLPEEQTDLIQGCE